MPLTPAHAAVAMPLSRAAPGLPLAPLVIGTLSPDFEHLFRLPPSGRFAHSLLGLVVFSVPVSLLAWGLRRAIVRPAFVRLLPPGMAAMMSHCARRTPRSVVALAGLGALAALLGALSHVAWDAFDKLPTMLGFAAVGAMVGLVLAALVYGVLAGLGDPDGPEWAAGLNGRRA